MNIILKPTKPMHIKPSNIRSLAVSSKILVFVLILPLIQSFSLMGEENANFSSGVAIARKFGVHEIILKSEKLKGNPFDLECGVIFYSPTGKQWQINAFYDDENTWKARVYVNEAGIWKWQSFCKQNKGLDRAKGTFVAKESNLRGMLRKSPDNPKQWITDNGKWFLNINDTGYLLFNERENLWQQYIEDLSKLGVSSVRAMSLGGLGWKENSELNSFYQKAYPGSSISGWPWAENDLSKLNLQKFQTTDQRLIWMLNNYPGMYVQFILFAMQTWGKDDTGEFWESLSQDARNKLMQHMIARWSAFPQLFYLIVNDMHCSEKYPKNQAFVREVGKYFAANDPWHHLISTGPNRTQVFPFTGKEDLEWVSYIHIEDMLALDAREVELYSSVPLHVFLGEDWYEHTRLDRSKDYLYHPDYFYRWLFWSWTLSGGSANYGGRWAKVQPYFSTDSLLYIEPLGGVERSDLQSKEPWNEISGAGKNFVQAKYNTALKGLNSIKYLSEFFETRKIDLSKFIPDKGLVTDLNQRDEKGYLKAMRKENKEIIVYDPNALCGGNNTLLDKDKTVQLAIEFEGPGKDYEVEWYSPADGKSFRQGKMKCSGKVLFHAPLKGTDMVLYLKENN